MEKKKSGKKTRIIDISTLLNLASPSVTNHLNSLKKIKFLDYDSVNSELTGQFVYTWKSENLPDYIHPYKTLPSLTSDVAKILFENKRMDFHAITNELLSKKHKSRYQRWKEDLLLHSVSRILAHLSKLGLAESNYKIRQEHSHVWLTNDYAEIVEEIVRKSRDALQGGNELKALQALYQRYIADDGLFVQHATNGLSLYLPVSGHINKLGSEERQRRLLEYLTSHASARPRNMEKDLGFYVIDDLKEMLAYGVLVIRREGKKAIYSVNPDYKPQ